ncbi:TrmH family RNA methyltransferase [Clostridium algifaecis]|uniref:TrmH family RNA methyltransferase n=1 Tax=Clostridium algifaecis TaxID=1472040 RepID=A0ABS4KS52_9CLOT|nr:RNA methyltransferase [Clostridium algifaecis]MBP2032866.1 TrmH family RNA methyltransferase [Clostridium algifaecis]
MNLIESKSNTHIKEVRKLKDRKYRNGKHEFLIEGFRFLEEALKSEFEISMIFIRSSSVEKWEKYKEKHKIKENVCSEAYDVEDSIFKTISDTDNSQGVIAVVHDKKLDIQCRNGFYILADKIQDPGNMGTIIRSAHASGALGVIITKGTVDVYNQKTLRATMGSIFHVPIIYDDNLENTIMLKKSGFKIAASMLETELNFYNAEFNDKTILAVGNEGNGLSDEIKDIADIKVRIPMPGGAESLNASVAASIMMFELVRRGL